jgi:hypothetical protein
MRYTKEFEYTDIQDYDEQFEAWQKENPKAVVVEVLQKKSEAGSPYTGPYKAFVTYEE